MRSPSTLTSTPTTGLKWKISHFQIRYASSVMSHRNLWRHRYWICVNIYQFTTPRTFSQNASFKLHAKGQCGRSVWSRRTHRIRRTFRSSGHNPFFMGAKLNAWFLEEFWCWWCRFRFGDIKDSLKANHHTTINCVGGDRIREFDQMRAIGLNIGSKWWPISS